MPVVAVQAPREVLRLPGNARVALARQDVEDGLRADDLGTRRDQRRVAEVGTDAGVLFEDERGASCSAPCSRSWPTRFEIMPPGTWWREHASIDAEEVALELPVLLAHVLEVGGDVTEGGEVEAGGEVRVFGEGGDERFGRWLGGAASEAADGAVDHVRAGLDAHEVGHLGVAGGVVAVHLQQRERDGPSLAG